MDGGEQRMKRIVLVLLIALPARAGHKPKWPAFRGVAVIQVKTQGYATRVRDVPDYNVSWHPPQSEQCQADEIQCATDVPQTRLGHHLVQYAFELFETWDGRHLVADCGGTRFRSGRNFEAQLKGSKLVVHATRLEKKEGREMVVACSLVESKAPQ